MVERALEAVDAWIEGEGVRRGQPVRVDGEGLRVGDVLLSHDSIYWTSRRAGLLMVFAEEHTAAAQGPRHRLDELARMLERQAARVGRRHRLPEEVAREVVVCTAGVAAVGNVGGSEIRGLRLAAFTRAGLHLVSRGDYSVLAWPADEFRPFSVERKGRVQEALHIRSSDDHVRLLYLFPEERKTARRLAGFGEEGTAAGARRPARATGARPPVRSGETGVEPAGEGAAGRPGEAGADGRGRPSDDGEETEPPGVGTERPESSKSDEREPARSLELFARGEVAHPVRAELPQLHQAAGALAEASETAARRLTGNEARRAELGLPFFETHLLELGEIALGPLLLRKSAASTADSLRRAVEAMDAGELQDDTRAAMENAAERLFDVYHRELTRWVNRKRAPSRVEDEHSLTGEERRELRRRLLSSVEKLAPHFQELEERQSELLGRLGELEEAPPEAEAEEAEMEKALGRWQRALKRVDAAFEAGWHGLVGEIVDAWEDRFVPALAEVAAMRRRRLPEWLRLLLLAVATLLAAAGVAIFLAW